MSGLYLRIAAALLAVLTAPAMLSSCGSGSDGIPESASESPQTTAISDEAGTQFTPLTEAELREFYTDASRVYLYFTSYGSIGLSAETAEIGGKQYQKVTEPGLSSRADLEALCREYFDNTITASLMAATVGDSPLFIDHDGALYRFGGYAALLSYDGAGDDRFELISSSDDFASFSVTGSAEVYGAPVSANYVYIVEYTDGKPLFTDYKPLAQVIAEACDKAGEDGRFTITEYGGMTGMVFRDHADPDAKWIPLASYGQNACDYAFPMVISSLNENAVNIWPGADGERYITLGLRPANGAPDKFTEYRTYRVISADDKIVSAATAENFISHEITDNGIPYSGKLDGTYNCKSYNEANGSLFQRQIVIADGIVAALVSLDGTDATVSYGGTYDYNSATGVFSAKLTQTVYDETAEGGYRAAGSGSVSGKLLVYGGFLHFICRSSDFADLSPSDPVPLTYELPDGSSKIASYRPHEAAGLLFCHKIFASDAYLLSYLTEPNTVCVYYTSDGGISYRKLDIKLPDGIAYDTARAVSAADGGGSGEACFYVALTTGAEVKYLRYDNFAFTDETNWLTFVTDGKYISKEDVPGLT